ncbi:helix-turn-helix domain-containing protein [Erwinia papayae]|uniref:Helix-turn-helix domain-containing protein n=1 Tax=Erwinia papayae TaxID=206499 RepID=A0ABV3N3V1_9GAMM
MTTLLKDNSNGFQLKPQQGIKKFSLLSSAVTATDENLKLDNLFLFARPVTVDAEITFSLPETEGREEGKINKPAIMLSTGCIDVSLKGCWNIELFSVAQLATFLAFLNYQHKACGFTSEKSKEESPPGKSSVLVNSRKDFVGVIESKEKTFMRLLFSDMLKKGVSCMNEFFSFVRGLENYWVAYFLLSQVMEEKNENDACKLYNACKVYGVSESHFRKLCHNAFTCGPKKQLRLWRAAYSALQLIEKDNTIATVAGNNGYASSSHFSSEIKSLFGITPREFKKMGIFLHE